VRHSSIFQKTLLLVVAIPMLSLHLAGIKEDCAVPSFEGAIVEVAFMAGDDGGEEDCLLRSEPELSFNVDLVPAVVLSLPGDRLRSPTKPAKAVTPLKEILFEIFTPPEIVS
jgi:hypothetical protein